MPFIKVALKNEIAVGEMKKYDVKENEMTIVNLGGEFFAFEDRCPHMNSPLHLGSLEGDEIVCPLQKQDLIFAAGKKSVTLKYLFRNSSKQDQSWQV